MVKPHIWSPQISALDDKIYQVDKAIEGLLEPEYNVATKARDALSSPNHRKPALRPPKAKRKEYDVVGRTNLYRT
jgi:hypothetical protein